MLTLEKSKQLEAFLSRLPEAAALRLAKAVETDRLAGGRTLPHELILGALRPVLRRQRQRTPTPLRLFCQPFEDLLVQYTPREKQKARIPRSSIAVVWRWLGQTLLPDAAAAYCAEINQLILAGRSEESLVSASVFWEFASRQIREEIAANRKAARAALRSDLVLADAEEMAFLLSAGLEIARIQKLLVKPVPQLTEELLHDLRDIHDRIAATTPEAAPYVACVAMSRLVHPCEALRLPQLITRQTQDTLISSTDMGLVGEVLFADIEFHGNAVRTTRHPTFDPEALIGHLAHFVELSSNITKEIDMRRDGKWGKRLLADRAAIAETMEGLMEHAPKEVFAMLPVQKSGSYGGGPKCADLSRPVDDEKADRGLRYARLVAGCAPYAAMGSFATPQKDAMDAISQHLSGYNEDIIREMRAPPGERHPAVERQFELAAELTALIFSPEEADLLRRRAKAALAAAA
jgi:hypothetical protein